MPINPNKIVDMHEDIMHSLISLNCEMIRQDKKIMTNEERLKNDVKENENICPMKTCMWNLSGKCNQNGMFDVLKECRENNYKNFEADVSQKKVNSGYLGKC